jgi:hypothetical protein
LTELQCITGQREKQIKDYVVETRDWHMLDTVSFVCVLDTFADTGNTVAFQMTRGLASNAAYIQLLKTLGKMR